MTYREGTPFQRALKALRGNWQSALMIGFIVCMIQLLPQVLLLFDSQQTLESLSGDANYETLSQLLEQRLVPLALMLVAPLISSVFLQGLMVHLLKLFRGQPAEVKDAFCRLRNAPRIIGLEVLVFRGYKRRKQAA